MVRSQLSTPARHGAGGASVDVRAQRAGDRRRARVGGAATTSARAVPGIGRASDSSGDIASFPSEDQRSELAHWLTRN